MPDGVDYETWLGAAPWIPFNANRFHYKWHWHWHFGTGDMGNDGVHHMDHRALGAGRGATRPIAGGHGKKSILRRRPADPRHDERRLRPREKTLIWEMRIWNPYGIEGGVDNGIAVYGDQGAMLFGRWGRNEGVKVLDSKGAEVEHREVAREEGTLHMRNFLDCVKSRESCQIATSAKGTSRPSTPTSQTSSRASIARCASTPRRRPSSTTSRRISTSRASTAHTGPRRSSSESCSSRKLPSLKLVICSFPGSLRSQEGAGLEVPVDLDTDIRAARQPAAFGPRGRAARRRAARPARLLPRAGAHCRPRRAGRRVVGRDVRLRHARAARHRGRGATARRSACSRSAGSCSTRSSSTTHRRDRDQFEVVQAAPSPAWRATAASRRC